MNNKVLSAVLIAGIATTGFATFSSADFDMGQKDFRKGGFERIELTDEQRAEMQAEREAKKIEREAYENVIDKLLAGETLTGNEEVLRAEIIEKRAEKKAEREAREAKMEEIKPIMEKKRNGEELTDEEQTKLEEFKAEMKEKRGGKGKGGKRGHGGFNMMRGE